MIHGSIPSRRGRSKKYPGKISRVHADGSFDVAYDDGESESRVEARLITPLDGGGSDSDRRSGGDRLREGDKIEADYRGRGKFYPGKISRDRGDDTYDIAYDDGERETRVSKRLIRKKDRSRSRSPRGSGRLREGDKVEAGYRTRGRFYPGKISRDRGDDTYDIDYDDGERETRVAKRLIRKKGGSRSPSPKRGRKLREGAKVQCRYRGRSKFYPGRIERDRGDGTYDIYYDDGEKETRVLEELIKAEDAGSSDEERKRDDDRGRGRMRVGDKIEARYRGP